MTSNEHKLARALVAAHTDPSVAPIVLDAIDGWAEIIEKAQAAIDQAERTTDDLQRYYTVKELRLLLKLSDSGVRALIDTGVLPSTRVGNAIRVPIAAVNDYLASNTSRLEQPTRVVRRRPRRSESDEATLRRYPWLAD